MESSSKLFYSLVEISPIVNIKYRQLLNRSKQIIKKYKDKENLLYKKSNVWYIHYSIINEFQRKRKPISYSLFITIASKHNYTNDYWKYYIKELNKILKKIDSENRIKYVIEKNRNNINHLHFITTYNNKINLTNIINNHILTNKSNSINKNIKYIYEVMGLHSYFKKQNKPILLR